MNRIGFLYFSFIPSSFPFHLFLLFCFCFHKEKYALTIFLVPSFIFPLFLDVSYVTTQHILISFAVRLLYVLFLFYSFSSVLRRPGASRIRLRGWRGVEVRCPFVPFIDSPFSPIGWLFSVNKSLRRRLLKTVTMASCSATLNPKSGPHLPNFPP